MDLQHVRSLFPITDHAVFLNNAAESPLSRPVRRRLDEYLDSASRTPHRKPTVRKEVRKLLAQLLGGQPEEYALITSTGVGIGIAAAGYAWAPGDNVVVPAEEHWNNTFPWLALRERGVEVRIVPLEGDMRLDPDRLAAHVDFKTRMVAVAAVRHTTGFRADLPRLSEIAHRHNALFVVDGIQAAGVVPLNVDEDGIDVLSAAGFKWLLGLPGTGFLYVRKACQDRIRPVLPGMFSAEDDLTELRWLPGAQRYETGSLAYSLFHAWTAGLELLLELGVPAIHQRVLDLTARIAAGLRAQGMAIVTPLERREERSAILSFTAGSETGNQALLKRLDARNIAISLRGGRCRVSPSFFNTEAEIDRFLETIET